MNIIQERFSLFREKELFDAIMSKLDYMFILNNSHQVLIKWYQLINIINKVFWPEEGLTGFNSNYFLKLIKKKRSLYHCNLMKNLLNNLELPISNNFINSTLIYLFNNLREIFDYFLNIFVASLVAYLKQYKLHPKKPANISE